MKVYLFFSMHYICYLVFFMQVQVKYGDVSARQALRDRLHCKPFKWYLTEVFPELPVRGPAVALGEVCK